VKQTAENGGVNRGENQAYHRSIVFDLTGRKYRAGHFGNKIKEEIEKHDKRVVGQ